jgi:hypothetical protein
VTLLSSIRQHFRVPAALQTLPTQPPVRDESEISSATTRKHRRSFAFVCCIWPLKLATTADKFHKTTWATTPSQEVQAEQIHSGSARYMRRWTSADHDRVVYSCGPPIRQWSKVGPRPRRLFGRCKEESVDKETVRSIHPRGMELASMIAICPRRPCCDCVTAMRLELVAGHTTAALDCLRL